MARLEFHGISQKGYIQSIEMRLRESFHDAPYAKEIVVEMLTHSDVRNLEGRPEPFIQIYGTRRYLDKNLADIKMRLKRLELPLEVSVLDDHRISGDAISERLGNLARGLALVPHPGQLRHDVIRPHDGSPYCSQRMPLKVSIFMNRE